MDWISFGKRDPRSRTFWGYTFLLTNEHLSSQEAQKLRSSCDKLADQALVELKSLTMANDSQVYSPAWPEAQRDQRHSPNNTPDLFALLRDNAGKNEVLGKLWNEVTSIPEWVDWEQLAAGQGRVSDFSSACH